MNKDSIVITDLSKSFKVGLFGKKVGVRSLSLAIPSGEVIGLLGPNGSGKSTTIKLILNFLRPDRGEILVCGHPSQEKSARQFLGYLPENPRFQKFLKGKEILAYYGRLLGLSGKELVSRCHELLELVSLSHAANEKVHGYSKGMTQRLAIAQALIHRPPVLILDEPMSGLDPIGRIEIRKLITRIHEEMPNATLFFSTHVLTDVEELCSSVALLRKGELVAFNSIQALLETHELRYEVLLKDLPEPLMKKYDGMCKKSAVGNVLTLEGTTRLMSELEEIKKLGGEVVAIHSARRKLEEALFKGQAGGQ